MGQSRPAIDDTLVNFCGLHEQSRLNGKPWLSSSIQCMGRTNTGMLMESTNTELVYPDNVQVLPLSRTLTQNVNTVLLQEVVNWAESVATEAVTIAQDLLQHAQAMAQTLKQIRANSPLGKTLLHGLLSVPIKPLSRNFAKPSNV